MNTVTRDNWSVSCTVPGMNGEPCTLNVFKFIRRDGKPDLFKKGEGYGKVFNNSEEAFAWALVHGYLQPYYGLRTPKFFCKKHKLLSHGFRFCVYCDRLKPKEKGQLHFQEVTRG